MYEAITHLVCEIRQSREWVFSHAILPKDTI